MGNDSWYGVLGSKRPLPPASADMALKSYFTPAFFSFPIVSSVEFSTTKPYSLTINPKP